MLSVRVCHKFAFPYTTIFNVIFFWLKHRKIPAGSVTGSVLNTLLAMVAGATVPVILALIRKHKVSKTHSYSMRLFTKTPCVLERKLAGRQ